MSYPFIINGNPGSTISSIKNTCKFWYEIKIFFFLQTTATTNHYLRFRYINFVKIRRNCFNDCIFTVCFNLPYVVNNIVCFSLLRGL